MIQNLLLNGYVINEPALEVIVVSISRVKAEPYQNLFTSIILQA